MMAPPSHQQQQPQPAASTSSTSLVKHFEHYFPLAEVEHLTAVARGKQSMQAADTRRLSACAFAEFVGARLGFPRRTIATAQLLYHRFHLFFALRDFPSYHEPVLATLYVSSKLHDTLKKPREIVLASYGVRYPDLLGGKATLSDSDVDVATLEADRLKVLAIERLVLETVCFNFSVQTPFEYVLKCGKALGASKALSLAAYRVSIDCYRTQLPLSYPPHALALGSLYIAALLGRAAPPPLGGNPGVVEVEEKAMMLERARAGALEEVLRAHGPWEDRFAVRLADVEQIALGILQLFEETLPPSTPAAAAAAQRQQFAVPTPGAGAEGDDDGSDFSTTCVRLLALAQRSAAELTAARISLRQRSIAPRTVGQGAIGAGRSEVDIHRREERQRGEGVGRNEVTVRFLFS